MSKHIICVGAVYIDTILSVPKYPIQDEKLRATSHARRRGGNCANTLEVLSQLVSACGNQTPATHLHLLTVLPKEDSSATKFIRDSLPHVQTAACIYREAHHEAASSYVLQNAQNQSRTIISYNPLEEMETREFMSSASKLLAEGGERMEGWYHFEGRVPETTLQCVQFLRATAGQRGFRVSVECEKPEREGMAKVAELADVVFYSKIWVTGHGFTDPRTFLKSQISAMMPSALLCCTWGDKGAVVAQKQQNNEVWAEVPAWKPRDESSYQVVDTIGAGDTFIAGMLFALAHHEEDWTLEQKLSLANELAGRKVIQHGFSNLVGKKRARS